MLACFTFFDTLNNVSCNDMLYIFTLLHVLFCFVVTAISSLIVTLLSQASFSLTSQRREAQERRERILRERKSKTKKSQVGPAYNVDTTKPVEGHKVPMPR